MLNSFLQKSPPSSPSKKASTRKQHQYNLSADTSTLDNSKSSNKTIPRSPSHGLLTTWSGSTAHSRPFRRVGESSRRNPMSPLVKVFGEPYNSTNNLRVQSTPTLTGSNSESNTITTITNNSNMFNRNQQRRRHQEHLAWDIKPTSLVSKSVSAPHRRRPPQNFLMFGQTMIDVHAPTDWTIASLLVTIPITREEETSPINDGAKGHSDGRVTGGQVNNLRLTLTSKSKNTKTNNSGGSNSQLSFSTIKTPPPSPPKNSLIRSVRGRYTNYIICVVAGHKTWHIGHRYSEFEQLHMNLRMHLGKSILPPFPPKYRLNFNNLDPSFVEKRRSQLELYLSSLVRISQVWSCKRLMVDFLDNNIETLGMQTKYERLMRVQGVLLRASHLNAQKNANTERALQESKRTVEMLKEKVERLEKQVLEQQRAMETAMKTNIQEEIAKQLAQQMQALALGGGGSNSLVPIVGDSTVETTGVPRLEDQVVTSGDSLALCNGDLLSTSLRTLSTIMPSIPSEEKRNKVISFIRHIVKECLGCDVYLTGSYPTKTYLPDGDIDMTACICHSQEDNWYSILLDAICKTIHKSKTSTNSTTDIVDTKDSSSDINISRNSNNNLAENVCGLVVRNATFVNAEVKVIKCVVDNINVDISAKQFNALSTVRLVEEFDRGVDDPVVRKKRPTRNIDNTKNQVNVVGGNIIGDKKEPARDGDYQPTTTTTSISTLVKNCRTLNPDEKHLFKRSLLLLKAWLSYDAPVLLDRDEVKHRRGGGRININNGGRGSGSGSMSTGVLFGSDKGGLSTYALVIMLMMLFNCHKDIVERLEEQELGRSATNKTLTPIHVLCMFLDTFAQWQWGLHSITTHGPLHIYTQEIVKLKNFVIDMNRQPFNASFFQTFRTLENNGVRSRSTGTSEDANQYVHVDVEKFRLGACNVVDPVNRTNNVGRALSRQRLQRLVQGLKLGQNRMKIMLQQDSMNDNVLSLVFPVSLTKFGDNKGSVWRPDLLVHPRQSYRPHSSSSSTPSSSNPDALYRTVRRRGRTSDRVFQNISSVDILVGDLETFIKNVEYAEIVETVGWTSKSLKDIIVQLILSQSRGGLALPVGEIGKGLLERTGNISIMSEIKERYGGLKRFLESQDGITVGEDHPFNPSVTLDKSLIPPGYVIAELGADSGRKGDGSHSTTGSTRKKRRKKKERQKEKLAERRGKEERETIETVSTFSNNILKLNEGGNVDSNGFSGSSGQGEEKTMDKFEATSTVIPTLEQVGENILEEGNVFPEHISSNSPVPFKIGDEEFPALN